MALNSRVALGIATIVALLLVAVLPPRGCTEWDDQSDTSLAVCGGLQRPRTRSHAQTLQGTGHRLRNRLYEHLLADSLRALVRTPAGVRTADGSIVVLYEQPITADSARVWLDLARSELDHIAGTRTRTRIVIALETNRNRLIVAKLLGEAQPELVRARRFTSVVAGDTNCFVVLRLERAGAYRQQEIVAGQPGARYGAFLGTCGLVGRFGMPGVAAYRAARFAFSDDRNNNYSLRSTAVPDEQRALKRIGIVPGQADYRLVACVRGNRVACAARYGLAGYRTDLSEDYERVRLTGDLLSNLLADKGPEAFGRFWRAPGTIEQALAATYGKPADELVRGLVQQRFYLREEAGSGPQRDVAWATMGWLALAVVSAFAIGMRRQVSG